ncbi:MAG TPA: carboxylesterase family protein [Propionibacteriaceae bacterium]|nr:carboxylesterase family protein [Propionibacteriaceae bacterium]
MTDERPVVQTTSGAVQGVWRGHSAAFYGVPFAQPPVGRLRFAAPVPALPWDGVRDASAPGPTPQRRPFGPVTTIPEPSFPGEETLNVNVFTPAPGDTAAQLPVLVWIHGGGFFAGSPSSPWYDGRSFNRDGVVTVALSYRLGFDGFGWIADAPTNRGIRDMIAGLEWVRDNIASFGGDPSRVTIAGQSAGGSAVISLLASPLANGLFHGVISHSGGRLTLTLDQAERHGRELARRTGVEPTVAGWSALTEDEVLDAQLAYQAPTAPPPATPADQARTTLALKGARPSFMPLVGDDVLPVGITAALEQGAGADVGLVAGTVAHEFTLMTADRAEAWAGTDPVQALVAGGMDVEAARAYVSEQPELTGTAGVLGQLGTDVTFRIPTLQWADAHGPRTWVYDFRWPTPLVGLAYHCLDLPFAWDLLDAQGVTTVCGDQPPQGLADDMHAAWVRFITTGDPGWDAWKGHNPRVFGTQGDMDGTRADTYGPTRILAASLS